MLSEKILNGLTRKKAWGGGRGKGRERGMTVLFSTAGIVSVLWFRPFNIFWDDVDMKLT